jgi:predicted nucleic acid-binding protein
MKIYLDVCCLNRPFDDLTQDKIRIESEAIITILEYCQIGKWRLVSSEVVDIEISKIADLDKRHRVKILATIHQTFIAVDKFIEARAIEIEWLGLKAYDALHIACAEKSETDIFLTTDDSIIKKALQNKDILRVRIENPVKWLMEVI